MFEMKSKKNENIFQHRKTQELHTGRADSKYFTLHSPS